MRGIPGEDHSLSTNIYYSIGLSYYNLANFEVSKDSIIKALNSSIKINGENSQNTAAILNFLGNVHFQLNDYKSAISSFQKSIKIKIALFEPDHKSLRESYNGLSMTYKKLNQFTEALIFDRKALDIARKNCGENSIEYANCINSIAIGFHKQGKYSIASEHYLKSLQIFSQITENQNAIADIYNNLGYCYKMMKDETNSLKYLEEALKKADPKNSLFILAVYGNLREVYFQMKDYEKALEINEKSREILEKNFGESSQQLLMNFLERGLIYEALSDYPKALENGLRSLQISERSIPTGNYSFVRIYKFMGKINERLNDINESKRYYLLALEIIKKEKGEISEEFFILKNYLEMQLESKVKIETDLNKL
jgi:tetratricopeptide (TPR) repeat protein